MTTAASSDHTAHPAHPGPVFASPVASAPGSRLGPDENFPEDLTGLEKADLQVLHSRISRQLDHDYLIDPAGPHPATTDRHQELLTELDARETA